MAINQQTYHNVSFFERPNKKTITHPLAPNFAPATFDVICSNSKQAKMHPGNIRFRKLVDQLSTNYANVTNRIQKTRMVSQIIDFVHNANGAFVKFEAGQWYEVGDAMAREKVGQALRERNHGMYRSSTKSKRKMRKVLNQRMLDRITTVVQTNEHIAIELQSLSDTLNEHRQRLEETNYASSRESDLNLEIAMTNANSQILACLKTDMSIQTMLQDN